MQIDLQPPMEIISVKQDKAEQEFKRDGNVYYIKLKKFQKNRRKK